MSIIPWRQKREETGREALGESPLTRFRSEMDTLFERFLPEPWGTSMFEALPARFGWGPRIDLAESENEITVKAELPGVAPEDVSVEIVGNSLTIHGEKKEQKQEKQANYHYVERQYGAFRRTIQLPSTVDQDKAKATFKDGVLSLTLPKHPEAKPKRISVQAK